jgi:hypothetical protein
MIADLLEERKTIEMHQKGRGQRMGWLQLMGGRPNPGGLLPAARFPHSVG